MKKIGLLLSFLFVGTSALMAQTKAEKEVATASENLRLAILNADKSTLDKILCDELTYGHSGGNVETKAHLIETLVSGESDFVKMDVTEQTILVKGKTAIVRNRLFAETNNNKVPGTVKLFVLYVFQKEGSTWKLLARQAVKDLK